MPPSDGPGTAAERVPGRRDADAADIRLAGDSVLDLVRSRFGIADGAEVTVESNPGPDERGAAADLVAAGVNRLSLGAQAFDRPAPRRLGRRHRPEHVGTAVREAREAGIGSISVDLLYDVPGQSIAAWAATLDDAIDLGVDHVSAYALTLDDPDAEGLTGPLGDHLPTTAGARRWRVAALEVQDDDRAAAQYRLAVERLGTAGFRGYEISNWGRPGHESRHNLAYWSREPYEAVGPGAHAFDGSVRRWNAARLDGYLAALALAGRWRAAALPPGGTEAIDTDAAAVEAVPTRSAAGRWAGARRRRARAAGARVGWALTPVSWSPWRRLPASESASRRRAACSRTGCPRASSQRHATDRQQWWRPQAPRRPRASRSWQGWR